MANDILTAKNAPGVTAKLVAAHLADKASFCKSISKEPESTWDDQYKAASPGDTIYVKVPSIMEVVEDNLDITSAIKDIKDTKVALTLDKTSLLYGLITASPSGKVAAVLSNLQWRISYSHDALGNQIGSFIVGKFVFQT